MIMVEGWGKLLPIFGKFEIWFSANFGLLLVETMNPFVGIFCTSRQNPCPTRASENLNEIALLEFQKNSVEFRQKTRIFHGDAKISKSLGVNNGVMLRFPPGSSVTVRVTPHDVLGVE